MVIALGSQTRNAHDMFVMNREGESEELSMRL